MYSLELIIKFILQDTVLWAFSVIICFTFFFIWKKLYGFKKLSTRIWFYTILILTLLGTPFIIMSLIHNIFWQTKSVSCIMLDTVINSEERCMMRSDCELTDFIAPGSATRGCLPLSIDY